MSTSARYPVERLAELDAGALGALDALRCRHELDADPRTPAARAALAATAAELVADPTPEPPPELAARCAVVLAELPTPEQVPPHAARARLALAAAAVVAGLALGIGWAVQAHQPDPAASPEQPPQAFVISKDRLASAVGAGLAGRDLGPFADPARLAACQQAVGLPAQQPLGARQVVLDGRQGVMLVLPTGTVGRFRLVVLDPACGADTRTGSALVFGEVIAGR